MPMLRPALFLACVALPALAQTPRPLLHGDLQGDKKRGKPFEEVCPVGERLVGLGMRVELPGTKKIFGLKMAAGGDSVRIAAVAPICGGADTSHHTLTFHGGGNPGKEDSYVIKPGERLLAVSGNYMAGNDKLQSLQLHMDDKSSKVYGAAAWYDHGSETTTSAPVFILSTPPGFEAVGIQGRAEDEVFSFGLVYARSSEPVPDALQKLRADTSGPRPTRDQIAESITRGLKMKGDVEGGEASVGYLASLKSLGQGFSFRAEGPLNQIANDASAHARRKEPYTADSITSPILSALVITVHPNDPESIGSIKGSDVPVWTGQANTVSIVVKNGASELVIPATWAERVFFPASYNDAYHAVGGLRAYFPISALPPGTFSVRVATRIKDYTTDMDAKGRAKIR
ncbi:MAG TPA: hypothetical protein VIV65_00900 [Gemmatimonadaceae bacterium]